MSSIRTATLRRAAAVLVSLLAVATLSTTNGTGAGATARSLRQVSSFGSNPGALTMYEYVPAGLPAHAPLVVALHGCSQSAADFFDHSGWPQLADRYRFALVFPQQEPANNPISCFNWYTPGDENRGGGEALSVRQMVAYEVRHRGVDTSRVFVTGLSAGGAMTSDLLADYPDVFAGGAVDAGIAAKCAADVVHAVACQETDQQRTPAQWAARVRSSDPGYAGAYPRVAIWQGTADTTVAPVNARELRDQWVAVHHVSTTPVRTRSLPGATTQTVYGRDTVELFVIAGMRHALAVHPGAGPGARCGTSGIFYADTICSSIYTLVFWRIA